MKKQLYRVKQLADQKVGRAEKTELLSEDLQHVEKTVEKIKLACHSTAKKLIPCVQSSGADIEKRKKKLPQMSLGQSMIESAHALGENSLLGLVLRQCGEAHCCLAGELANCDMDIDENVLAPLTKVLEDDIPSIQTAKKKLSKAGLDMDSLRTRWLNAVKTSQGARGDMVAAAAKADTLKEDLDAESALFHTYQDTLATEMLSFVAKEHALSSWVTKLLEAQERYHYESLKIIQKILPNLQTQVDESMFRPVFGCSLEDHLRVNDREIAFVIEECVLHLLENGLNVEGIFRLAGSAAKIKRLKASFDAGIVDLNEFENDVHAVTGILKQYLRELPQPLLTFELYDDWIKAASITERDVRLQALWTVCDRLPHANKVNLRYLVCFFAKVAENSEINKMSSSNIAIVLAPNLIWSEADDGGMNVFQTSNTTSILDSLIQHAEWFFPNGVVYSKRESNLSPISNSSPPAVEPTEEEPSFSGSLLSEVSQLLDLPASTTMGLLPENPPAETSESPSHEIKQKAAPPLPSRPPPALPPRGDAAGVNKPYTGHRTSQSAPPPTTPPPFVPKTKPKLQ